jgi:hypothetical protein
MHTRIRRKSAKRASLALTVGVAIVVASVAGDTLCPRDALAIEVRYFQTPFAQARVIGHPPDPSQPTDSQWLMDADFNQNELTPKYAFASVPTAVAQSSASLLQQVPNPRFGLVSARSSEISDARAQAQILFEVRDPQNRNEVLVDMQIKSAAHVQVGGLATLNFRLDRDSTLLGEVGIENGKIVYIIPPPPQGTALRSGFARVSRFDSQGPGYAVYEAYHNGVQVGRRQEDSNSLRANTFGPFPMKPGFYVVDIVVATSGPAIAVSDPVILPDPSNPDVVVTIHSAFDPVPRSALFGATAEDLAADGFDPAPFEDFEFIGPDIDEDGWLDDLDNCPATANPSQANADLDDLGDACDPDDDGDGVADEEDNCPTLSNAAQEDGDGDGTGDGCDPEGRVVHDLAIVALGAPTAVTLKGAAPAQTKQIKVGIQNRGLGEETIADAAALARLVHLDVQSLGACPGPIAALVPPKKFPLVLKVKQTLKVAFEATFACANDPAKSTKTEGHEDYRFSASLSYDEVAGGVDGHPDDDVCPRSVDPPSETDPRSDGKFKDKGCGSKKADKTFGDPVTTDVLVKP